MPDFHVCCFTFPSSLFSSLPHHRDKEHCGKARGASRKSEGTEVDPKGGYKNQYLLKGSYHKVEFQDKAGLFFNNLCPKLSCQTLSELFHFPLLDCKTLLPEEIIGTYKASSFYFFLFFIFSILFLKQQLLLGGLMIFESFIPKYKFV